MLMAQGRTAAEVIPHIGVTDGSQRLACQVLSQYGSIERDIFEQPEDRAALTVNVIALEHFRVWLTQGQAHPSNLNP